VNGWWNSERLRIGLAKKPVCIGRLVDGHFMEKGVYSTILPVFFDPGISRFFSLMAALLL
jgi:hypothetical protein